MGLIFVCAEGTIPGAVLSTSSSSKEILLAFRICIVTHNRKEHWGKNKLLEGFLIVKIKDYTTKCIIKQQDYNNAAIIIVRESPIGLGFPVIN